MSQWNQACSVDDVGAEDILQFDLDGRAFPILRSPDHRHYATDGLCTFGKAHLAGDLVMGNIFECPKHNGRFDYRTGEAEGAPACVNLKTYPVKVDDGK